MAKFVSSCYDMKLKRNVDFSSTLLMRRGHTSLCPLRSGKRQPMLYFIGETERKAETVVVLLHPHLVLMHITSPWFYICYSLIIAHTNCFLSCALRAVLHSVRRRGFISGLGKNGHAPSHCFLAAKRRCLPSPASVIHLRR